MKNHVSIQEETCDSCVKVMNGNHDLKTDCCREGHYIYKLCDMLIYYIKEYKESIAEKPERNRERACTDVSSVVRWI